MCGLFGVVSFDWDCEHRTPDGRFSRLAQSWRSLWCGWPFSPPSVWIPLDGGGRLPSHAQAQTVNVGASRCIDEVVTIRIPDPPTDLVADDLAELLIDQLDDDVTLGLRHQAQQRTLVQHG